MAEDSFQRLRLALMQDYLPVGMALYSRLRKNGLLSVFENMSFSNEEMEKLRAEGESDASSLRERLDQVMPGLGNPVISVDVNVDIPKQTNSDEPIDELRQRLVRIKNNLELLKKEYSG